MEEARHAYLRSDDGIHALILDRHVGGQAVEHVDPIQVLALELLPHSLVRLDGEDAVTLFPAREELGELAGAGAQVHEQRSFEPGDADFGEQGVDGFVREGGTVLVVEVCSQEAVARFRGQGGRHWDGWMRSGWVPSSLGSKDTGTPSAPHVIGASGLSLTKSSQSRVVLKVSSHVICDRPRSRDQDMANNIRFALIPLSANRSQALGKYVDASSYRMSRKKVAVTTMQVAEVL